MPSLGSPPYPECSERSRDGRRNMSRMNETENCSHFARTPLIHSRTHGAQPSCARTHWTHAEMCLNFLDCKRQRIPETAYKGARLAELRLLR
eukprot:969025-Alexandrium_andersonii.AAC.1